MSIIKFIKNDTSLDSKNVHFWDLFSFLNLVLHYFFKYSLKRVSLGYVWKNDTFFSSGFQKGTSKFLKRDHLTNINLTSIIKWALILLWMFLLKNIVFNFLSFTPFLNFLSNNKNSLTFGPWLVGNSYYLILVWIMDTICN